MRRRRQPGRNFKTAIGLANEICESLSRRVNNQGFFLFSLREVRLAIQINCSTGFSATDVLAPAIV